MSTIFHLFLYPSCTRGSLSSFLFPVIYHFRVIPLLAFSTILITLFFIRPPLFIIFVHSPISSTSTAPFSSYLSTLAHSCLKILPLVYPFGPWYASSAEAFTLSANFVLKITLISDSCDVHILCFAYLCLWVCLTLPHSTASDLRLYLVSLVLCG
jgi:hypothetical protein